MLHRIQVVGELPTDKEGRHKVKRTLRREKKQEASEGRVAFEGRYKAISSLDVCNSLSTSKELM